MSLGGLATLLWTAKQKEKPLGVIIVDIHPVTKSSVSSIKQSVQKTLELDSFDDFVKWVNCLYFVLTRKGYEI